MSVIRFFRLALSESLENCRSNSGNIAGAGAPGSLQAVAAQLYGLAHGEDAGRLYVSVQ